MTFLKWSMLLGLATIAIPIIIHLLNRSKPRVIEWGAMQFLRAALVTRSRRMQLEELVLMCLRCLSLALLALAMARPFLPSASAIPWAVIVPAILVAVALAGMATVLWSNQALRRRLLRAAAVLITLGLVFAVLERWIQARRWLTAGSGRDVVIVLDASMSMNLQTAGRTAFQQAVEEARTLITSSRSGDAFAIVLAGAVPEPLISRPTASRGELSNVLGSPACRVIGGRMSAPEAVNLATALLAEGANASKMVVVFTDGQSTGWDARADARWKFVASGFGSLPSPPRLVLRRLPVPPDFQNAAVSEITLSRRVIGTDRPVKIDVSVLNAGDAPLQPSAIDLVLGSNRVERIPIVKELLPHSTEIFRFDYTFDVPGYHVLRAELVVEDSLPDDNSLVQVAHVLDRLPVLLVEGASSERFFFRRASGFVRTALTPDRQGDGGTPSTGTDLRYLVEPTVVEASALPKVASLARYRVIILADVPRLPAVEAARVGAFVKGGGGLLVTPGKRALPEFYNSWQAPSGEGLMPAMLGERTTPADPLRLNVASMTHPSLRLVGQRDQSDVALGFVSAYWTLSADAADPLVRVGAQLEASSDPWLVERQLGRGMVLATATAFDRRDSTLPSLKCFVPLIHELVYFLAAPQMVIANVAPGTEWTYAGTLAGADAAIPPLSVITPSGESRQATVALRGRDFTLRVAETRQPGCYRVQLPPVLAQATGVASNGLAAELPFAVNAMPEESTLAPLNDSDLAVLRRHVDLFAPERFEELLAALAGEVPGQELWRILALCALVAILLETVLARWITIHRRLHNPETVELLSPADSVKATRARLSDMLATKGAE
jgi:hypothetical protein